MWDWIDVVRGRSRGQAVVSAANTSASLFTATRCVNPPAPHRNLISAVCDLLVCSSLGSEALLIYTGCFTTLGHNSRR